MTPEADRGGRGRDGSDGIMSALELLQEEVEREVERIDRAGADAFRSRDRVQVNAKWEQSEAVVAFRSKIAALIKEWKALAKRVNRGADGRTDAAPRNLGRLHKGERTAEDAFFMPILQVLSDMGGRGRAGEIVEQVGQVMEPVLHDVDYELLESDGKPRWQKAANWARKHMVDNGLLRADSPRGTWEISDEGRARLDSGSRSSEM